MNDFFKEGEDMSIPSDSPYMDFEEGDNRFRILGSFSEGTAIRGTLYWTGAHPNRKPVRLRVGVPVPVGEIGINKFGDLDLPKHFWALPVYNYQEKRVQILEITQKTILNPIKKTIENPKWGSPLNYDFTVTKSKEGDRTVYTVTNDPKEPIDKGILKLYKDMQINIEALYDGGDPFAPAENIKERDSIVNGAVAAGL